MDRKLQEYFREVALQSAVAKTAQVAPDEGPIGLVNSSEALADLGFYSGLSAPVNLFCFAVFFLGPILATVGAVTGSLSGPMGQLAAVLMGAIFCAASVCFLAIFLQVPFTWSWTRELARMHKQLAKHTDNKYLMKPSFAYLAGVFSSPALPGFVWLMPAVIFFIIHQDIPLTISELAAWKIPTQASISGNVITILFILLTVNGATMLGGIANGLLLNQLVAYINANLPPGEKLTTWAPITVPLFLVGPAWWFTWTFPQPYCWVYLVLAPIAAIFAFARLADIDEKLSKIVPLDERPATPKSILALIASIVDKLIRIQANTFMGALLVFFAVSLAFYVCLAFFWFR